MIRIARRKIDISVVVGVVVVFAVIVAAGWVGAEVLIWGPARERLEDAKVNALSYLDGTLGSITTSQAESAAASYRAQIQDAGSPDEVATIRSEATSVYNRELKREELLAEAELATNGIFYSFPDLESSLKSGINGLTSLSDLQNYEDTIDDRADNVWIDLHEGVIENFVGNRIVMRRAESNSPYTTKHVIYMTKDEAKSHIKSKSWSVLRELRFENAGSYLVPIIDTFQRVPTVQPEDKVDVYSYEYSTKTMSLKVGGAIVKKVIYPKEELGVIAWTLTDGDVSYSYSTDVWEAIKAATAGDTEAADINWAGYAGTLMQSALNAGVGDFDLQALYVIEVPQREDAECLTHIEQYLSATKDIILLAQVTS